MPSSQPQTDLSISCDIFCDVIDNFGDAGVCWRLAKQLAIRTGWSVRLIIDQIGLIDRLHPDRQSRPENLMLVEWDAAAAAFRIPDVVIEAFGCHLPDNYLASLRATQRKIAWVNLEYLSAEKWIEGCHQLMSPDPVSGKPKFFFFPGFSDLSGGLIHEPGLESSLHPFRDPEHGRQWLQSIGIATGEHERLISLFAYPDSPVRQLFRQFKHGSMPTHYLLAGGSSNDDLQKILTYAALEGVRASPLPFLPQDDFDRLLASCEINFVRGEDSFIRAQWIAKPFVWQTYRQGDGAHHIKLSAFLNHYLSDCEKNVAGSIRDLHLAWNGVQDWHEGLGGAFIDHQAVITSHNRHWAKLIGSNGNLAENLAAFCESKL